MKEHFEAETFDCVIDKGLLDSVLVILFSIEVWSIFKTKL